MKKSISTDQYLQSGKGRILINLCGKTDVRNCDLAHRDFFARYREGTGRRVQGLPVETAQEAVTIVANRG